MYPSAVAGRLAGKVAIITGAGTGIGYATAEAFLAQGARVALFGRRADALAQAVRRLGSPGRVHSVTGDVVRRDDVQALIETTRERFGQIDIAVSNAGIHRVRPFLDMSEEEWDEVLDINLRGSYLFCAAAAKAMRDASVGGSIVIVASTNSFVAEPSMAAYNTSKGGLLMLARSLAVDLAPIGIRANAVAPGTIWSEITQPMIEAGFGFGSIPLGRVGEAREVANAILFLASEEASYVTGAVLVVDGGQTALNGEAGDR